MSPVRGIPRRRPSVVTLLLALFSASLAAEGGSRPCQSAKVTASDGRTGQFFGKAVAVSGDTAVVGAFGDDNAGPSAGAAYVLLRGDAGWVESQKLAAPAAFADADDLFGCAVAVSGDVIVVGARGDEGECGDCRSGAAYVFEREPGGEFAFAARLTSNAGEDGSEFGFAVAVEDGVAVIGAARDRVLGVRSGAVWVFENAGGIWTRAARLAAPSRNEFDLFGFSVAIGGGTVAVGSLESDEMGPASGSAFVFEKTGGDWLLSQMLFRPDGEPDDMFGSSVAVSLDSILVGARGDDDLGFDSGSVYSFERAGGGVFSLAQKFHVPGAHQGDRSGSTLALEGDVAVVGSRCDDSIAENSGAAFVFKRTGGLWNQAFKLKAADIDATRVGAAFGFATALSGNTIFIGPHSDPDLGAFAGAAYAFALSGDGREGGVDTGDGSDPADVLRVAGRTGGICRMVSVVAGTPVDLDVDRAPSSLRGHYAVWILDGASGGATDIRFRTNGGTVLSLGTGPRGLPIANTEAPGSHAPLVSFPLGMTSRSIAPRNAELLCLNARPGHPTAPVRFTVVFPRGDFVVGGVVEDRNSALSPGKNFSLANWIFVRSTP